MYLTKINKRTGFVDIENEEDGVLAIKEFRDIINDKSLGIGCFTAIALSVDHDSSLRHYSEKDRPKKAMEEVTGNRNEYDWYIDKIQLALKKYAELQYNPTLEEGEIHYQRKVAKLKEYKESEQYYGKGIKDKDGKEILYKEPGRVASELRKINEDIDQYEKSISGKDLYAEAPSKSGYKLSRLEQKILKKNSFYAKNN